jgi:hypothetical protein
MRPCRGVVAVNPAVGRRTLDVSCTTSLLTCATATASTLLGCVALTLRDHIAACEHSAEGGSIGPHFRYCGDRNGGHE